MSITNKLRDIKKGEAATKKAKKWLVRLFVLLLIIIAFKGCITGCSEVMEDKKREAAITTDSIPHSYEITVNPTFPLKYPKGNLRCLTEVGLSEIRKYTKRDPNEQPMLEAVEYYIEGVVLDQFRNISINDRVLDTLSWKRYKQDSLYRLNIWEQIITTE